MISWHVSAYRTIRAAKRVLDRYARSGALLIAMVGIPVALVYLAPSVLGLVLDPLEIDKNASRPNPAVLALTFLDASGNVIGTRGGVVGSRLALNEMPPYLPAAFIATEDHRFYHHAGIDFVGLTRAAYLDWKAGHYVAGGSTITQQTAKILFTSRERTIGRKMRELVKSIRLEKTLGKNEILELYLNRLYLGDSNYGVDMASRGYFGVSARQVSLAQAAMLAALTRAPTVFSPRRDLATAQQRAAHVLRAMVQTGTISPAAAANAIAHPASIVERRHDTHTYFLDAADSEARKLIQSRAIAAGRLMVHTTLEANVQQGAEASAGDALGKNGLKRHFSQVAVVVMRPDGAVSGLVGGADYNTSVFDRVTQAHRQPGSAFKPFVYLAALQAGMSPWDERDDQPVDIAGYQPANYRNESYGRLRLTDALAHSVNTITVNLALEVGISNVAATARAAGIKSPLQDNASLALGTDEVTPLELTAAYCIFVNGGARVTPYLVRRIDTTAGDIAYERNPSSSQVVIRHSVLRDMSEMLYNVMTTGTGIGARLKKREAGGKTGTTQDYRDAWFVGFTTDYVAGVWIGNDDNSPMNQVTGGSIPAHIWKDVMLAAEQGHPAAGLDRTQGPPPDMQYTDGDALKLGNSDDELLGPPSNPPPGSDSFALNNSTDNRSSRDRVDQDRVVTRAVTNASSSPYFSPLKNEDVSPPGWQEGSETSAQVETLSPSQ